MYRQKADRHIQDCRASQAPHLEISEAQQISVASYLKLGTSNVHERLHHHPLTGLLISKDLGLSHYILVLQSFERFYSALECQLNKNACPLSDASVIRKDLSSLNSGSNPLPELQLPVFITELNSMLGVQYVLLGSGLGGQVIAKNLKRTLGLDGKRGARFFIGSGKKTLLMWRQFLQNLESACTSKKQCRESAILTFQYLEEWLWQVWNLKMLARFPHNINI
ncbi:MAG: biliverdin-producing heme oxygenase [Pseudomonadota bacterium]